LPEPVSRVRLQLGAELQAARRLAGLNQRDLAARVGISQSQVARVESGERLLARPKIQAWLKVTAPPDDLAGRALTFAEAAHIHIRTWRDAFAETRHLQGEAAAKNAAATLMQNFQPSVLPGLLQTTDYARATLRLVDQEGHMDQVAALAARITRQGILREPGHRFQFLIAERLLRWEPEPGTLLPQLAQLRAAQNLESVDLAVLPDSYAGTVPWHNFVIRYPAAPDEQPYVEAELIHGPETINDPESVQLYRGMWDRLWDAALTGDAAASLLERR
jgi:transcriptional regulator with XRE-family HTH domain